MAKTRNFNKEFDSGVGRKYGYDFDYDVMEPFMIKSFTPFFVPGNLLELGSFKGQFGPTVGTSMSLLALALNYRFLPIYER